MGYLDVAAGEVGYHSTVGGDIVKYWTDLDPGLQGEPWCFCFVSWCLWKVGDLAAIGGSPIYSCPYGMNKAKAMGQWFAQPEAGALVIYDWGTGVAAHVEFVVDFSSTSIHTIGGNTVGVTDHCVASPTRPRNSEVMGYWHLNAVPGTGGGVNSAGETLTAGPSYSDGTFSDPAVPDLTGIGLGALGVRFSHGANWIPGT